MNHAAIKISFYGIEKSILLLLFVCFTFNTMSQPDSTYAFLVAGHAYGAHSGENKGLHPPLLSMLNETRDSTVMGIFLTGDIVNRSTTESWKQVENEISSLGLTSFYVMGNHDNNSTGHTVFKEKHGGDYYYFTFKNHLYIVLNSTESDRSISQKQLQFLDGIFTNSDFSWDRAFIFFHEVIWNSHKKYRDVRSNSRSRYSQIVNISNFWDEVFPRLTLQTDKRFYLFAGDVGGNPDAIAASYDTWQNVTLLSSGMGEVPDENYLKVFVLPDTVEFQLVALNSDVKMKPVSWYNIPEKPDSIIGPQTVSPPQSDVGYRISPVENATSYKWILSSGIFGDSDSSQIKVHFASDFTTGRMLAAAVNDGFGESEPVELKIVADENTFIPDNGIQTKIKIYQNQKSVLIEAIAEKPQVSRLKIYDRVGRMVLNKEFFLNAGLNSEWLDMPTAGSQILIFSLLIDNQHVVRKVIFF